MINVDGKTYLTVNESCIKMGISVSTFHRWKRVDKGVFPSCKKYGERQFVYAQDDIEAYQKHKLG